MSTFQRALLIYWSLLGVSVPLDHICGRLTGYFLIKFIVLLCSFLYIYSQVAHQYFPETEAEATLLPVVVEEINNNGDGVLVTNVELFSSGIETTKTLVESDDSEVVCTVTKVLTTTDRTKISLAGQNPPEAVETQDTLSSKSCSCNNTAFDVSCNTICITF